MRLTWAHPYYLICIVIVAIVAVALLYRMQRHSLRWRAVCLMLPALAVACLMATLAGPMLESSPPAREMVLLLDLSGSSRTSPWRSPAWVQRFVRERLPAGTRVTAVAFGRTAKTLFQNLPTTGEWPTRWPDIEEQDSDLSAAVQWRTGPDDHRPRWLFTDGLLDMSALEQSPGPVALTVSSPTRADAGIADFQLREPPGGRPELQVTVRATGRIRATLEIRRGGTRIVSRTLVFGAPATQFVTVMDPAALPDSPVAYEAILTGHDDPWPENDLAALLTPPRGPPAMLVVTHDNARVPSATGPVTRIAANVFPARLAELLPYQIIVFDDVPAASLSAAGLEAAQSFVSDTGGGVLILGRSRAFGPGGYLDTPLEALSPLASVPPERPPLHVVFLLDASGSMKEAVGGAMKFGYVASGVAEASRVLRPTDRITAVVFGDRIAKLAEGTKESIAEPLARALRGITPSGPTAPDNTVALFESSLDENTRVILLTDGEIPKIDVPRWASLLAGTKAKLTLVAPRDPSTRTLAELAKATSATWLATSDATAWPRLLRQAIEEPQIGKARETQEAWRTVDGAASSTSRWIETWMKPDSRPLVVAPGIADPAGKPLAAIARRGLGQVVAVSFSDGAPPYASLMESILREITPPAGDRRFVATITRPGGRWKIEVQGRDPQAGFINGAILRARVVGHEGRESPVMEIPQVGPGQYAAELASALNVFSVVLTREADGRPHFVGRVSPALVASPEWPASTFSREMPPLSGLRHFDAEAAASGVWRARETGTRHDPRAALWLTAAAALIAALYLRRGGR